MTADERETLALLRQELAADRAATHAAAQLAAAEVKAALDKASSTYNGKLDLLIERQTLILTDMTDHEVRVRSLEKWKYGIPATLLMALAAAVGTVTK